MLGAVRSGLLFGIVGSVFVALAMVIPSAISPLLGFCICVPIALILQGLGTGYVAVSWNKERVGMGLGVLAGGIAGFCLLIMFIVMMLGVNAMLQSMALSSPETYQEILDTALSTQPSGGIDQADLEELLPASFLMVGACLGLLGLMFTLAFGALGAWFAISQRNKRDLPPDQPFQQYTAPSAAPKTPASFDPPPLSPRDDQ